jgi:hypothetical protein
MTVDLRDQLRELCAVIDDEQGPIAVDDIRVRNDAAFMLTDRPIRLVFSERRGRLVAVATAVVVLVVLAPLLLFSGDTQSDVGGVEPGVANPVASPGRSDSLSYQWSRVPHDAEVFGGGRAMSSVVAADSGLVAVGYYQPGDDVPSGRARDAAVWTSVEGVTWSRVPDDEVFGGKGNQRMHSVTAAVGGLVAVGADGGFYDTRPYAVVWTSVDGVTWSRVAHDEATFGGAEMHSVTVAGAGLVAVGDESLETKGLAERQEAIESGDSVFVWVAEPDG